MDTPILRLQPGSLNCRLRIHMRTMEGAIKWRAVVPLVRGHRGAAPASCAGLQSRQFLAETGDARGDQGLVADRADGEADQDRGEKW